MSGLKVKSILKVFSALEEAVKRFEYLKDHWQEVFPDGLTAVELVDQYFDQIDQFNPIN